MRCERISERGVDALFPPEAGAAAVHLACQQPNTQVTLQGPPADLANAKATLGECLGQDEQGNWWICVPVSRLCSTIIAWVMVALGW